MHGHRLEKKMHSTPFGTFYFFSCALSVEVGEEPGGFSKSSGERSEEFFELGIKYVTD